jgi:hypothetical protein
MYDAAWWRRAVEPHTERQDCTKRAHTRRIKPGSYYTDGKHLVQVYRVYDLGHIQVRDCETDEIWGYGIESFRRYWWLVREERVAG